MPQQIASSVIRGREDELQQVQQHVVNMQAKDIPDALAKCVESIVAQILSSHKPSTRLISSIEGEQKAGLVGLYVQCCLCMVRRAHQLSATGRGIMQEVTGLLQHELQKRPALLHAVYCQHAHLLLQDAAPLDVLLRMVPLFQAEQQAAIYHALHSALLAAPQTKESCTDGQAAKANPSVSTLTPLLQHCNRQLDRLVPQSVPLTQTHHPGSSACCLQDGVLSFRDRIGCAVRLELQLPALLALSLALPQSVQSMHSTDSMHTVPEPEGERESQWQAFFVCELINI
ncbi:hypothetical protein ABBQ32_003260 [Trebouxia sp. C0010 RCD-2024]